MSDCPLGHPDIRNVANGAQTGPDIEDPTSVRYGERVLTTETFGAMLRRHRTSAGLSQERLAERSGISATGVAALEAGRRKTPRLNTVGLLCDALQLDAFQRSALIAAATNPCAIEAIALEAIHGEGRSNFRIESAPPIEGSFVGRVDERQTLRDAWTNRTKVAVLFGEAGVGKSTLAEEFAAELTANKVTVLRGKSTPEQLGVYEAFVEPVRMALGRYDGKVPANLRDLGRLVPGLLKTGGENIPSRSDPAIERRLLFETVSTLLASTGPTLLLLDDLHWADPGTLAMLSFLVGQAELPDLMIVGTVRSTDVTPSTSAALAELRRRCSVTRILLSGLSQPELADLVSSLAGSAVSDALIEAVRQATNGNPLYIKELTEHLLQRGFDALNETPAVPDDIRHTIELRVAGLSAEAQLLLRSGAVLGQTFDLSLAGQIASLTGEGLLGALEDALLSGLLVEQTATAVIFSHGLVATTVYRGMPRLRRVLLHRAAAMALVNRGVGSSAEIVDVARHWALVAEADPLARNTAAQWSVRAGDAASASAAIEEAIACYRRAAALWDSPTAGHADTLVRLGSALTATGNIVEGKLHLQHGLRLADEAGDANVFAQAALGLSASVRYAFSEPERISELEAAIAKLDPTEMVLRPALLATLRRQLGFVVTDEADKRRTEAALAVADAVSSPTVSDELILTIGRLRDSLVVDDPIPLGQLARNIIRVASARQDLSALSTGWYRQAWSALELGEAGLFRQAVDEYRIIAQQLRRPYELALSANMIAAVAQIEGRYVDAESAGQEALAHAAAIEDGNFNWVYFANSGFRAVDQGLVAPTFEFMLASRREIRGLATFDAALVAIAAAAGDYATADAVTEELVGRDGEKLDRDWLYLGAERLPVVGLLAWGCGIARNRRYSTLLRDGLIKVAELGVRVVRVAPVGAWIGPIDHHIGTLSRVLGDLDRAQQHLEAALVVEDEMNGDPFRVRTMLELAAVAASRHDTTGYQMSAEWRGKAEVLAEKLGLESILISAGLTDKTAD